VEARTGAGVSNALLNVNTSQTATGHVGVALALPAGKAFVARTRELVVLRFLAIATGTTAIAFGDLPIPRKVSDAAAESVPANYADGSLTVTPAGPVGPALGLSRSGNSVVIFWPLENTDGFELWAAPTLPSANWIKVDVLPIPFGNQKIVPLTLTNGSGNSFFRLKKP
jgi:hypothetical protein